MKKCSFITAVAILMQLFLNTVVFAASEIKIEAESFTKAHSGVVVMEPPGQTVISVQPEMWMEYEITVDSAGSYSLYSNAACIDDISLKVILDGVNVPAGAAGKTGDWSVYQDSKLSDLRLSAGMHTLRITSGGGISLDYFRLLPARLGDKNTQNAADYDAGGEGVGYHDNTPGVDDEYALDRGDDVEVMETSDGLAVKMSAGEWLRYTLQAEESEAYTISLRTSCVSDDTVMRVSVNGEEFTKTLQRTASETDLNDFVFGKVLLNAGSNVIRVEMISGTDLLFPSFSLNKLNPADAMESAKSIIKTEFEDYMPGGEGVGYHDLTPGLDNEAYIDRGDDVEVAPGGTGIVVGSNPGEWMKYKINIPAADQYQVRVYTASPDTVDLIFRQNGGKKQTLSVPSTGTWADLVLYEAGTITLDAGESELQIEIAGGGINLDYFELVRLPKSMELYAAYAGDRALLGERTIPRGTDVLFAYFTDEIANSGTIEITAPDGTAIPTVCGAEKNVLTIKLKDTLSYDTAYQMRITGVSGKSGIRCEEETVKWKTGTEETDSGKSTVDSLSVTEDGGIVTVTGTILSGAGEPIGGRTISGKLVNVKKSSIQYVLESVKSNPDGSFSMTYQFEESAPNGDYNVRITPEYGQQKTQKINYISADQLEALVAGLKAAENAEDADAVFTQYEAMLGLNRKTLLTGVTDQSRFFSHFVKFQAESKQDIISAYQKYAYFERLNQANNTSKVKAILTNQDACNALSIDLKKHSLIQKNQNAFYQDIVSMEQMTELSAFRKAFDALADRWLLTEYEKDNVSLSVSDQRGNVGQGIRIPLRFNAVQTNLSEAVFTVVCPDETVAGKLSLVSKDAAIRKDGKNVTVSAKAQASETAAELQFTSGNKETVRLSVSAEVTYLLDGYSCKKELTKKELSVTVSEQTGGGGGSGGGKTTGSSAVIPSVKPQNPDKEPDQKPDDQPEKKEFSDLSEAEWAKESIERLQERGVVTVGEDQKFRPNDPISREEFVKMLVAAMGVFDSAAGVSFSDTPADAWYTPYIASAVREGLVYGVSEERFGVGEKITRQDMAVMLFRAMKKRGFDTERSLEQFFDHEDISDYAKDAVYTMRKTGIINGVGENAFAPKQTATRAMAARMVDAMMSEVGL